MGQRHGDPRQRGGLALVRHDVMSTGTRVVAGDKEIRKDSIGVN